MYSDHAFPLTQLLPTFPPTHLHIFYLSLIKNQKQ